MIKINAKPHIKKVGFFWMCLSENGIGFGLTIARAYQSHNSYAGDL